MLQLAEAAGAKHERLAVRAAVREAIVHALEHTGFNNAVVDGENACDSTHMGSGSWL